ncbi:MAG: FAD-dependent oxidoreductase [Candidatus Hydrogenedentes bacterium]|nr:FAD-dependent oxidoreductase [Candidatus Hydrogenedentota bacterium]
MNEPIMSETSDALFVAEPERAHLTSTDVLDRKWIDVNIPCKAACPVMTDVPGYIQAILEGDFETAYKINRRDNVFPHSLGRVCNRPCEPACRHGREGLGEPVAICHLKRASADFGYTPLDLEIVPNGKKVCVVGAGPAGLTAANDLAIKGYQVVVLEQYDEPGGMLRYGIPQFRLPYDVVAADVKSITDLGVEIRCNQRIDSEAQIELLKREYDAVILSGGCMLPSSVKLPGMDAHGFYWGLDFMMQANRELLNDIKLNKVVVIGGGFTAVDCTRTSYRLGASEITLAYRRTKDKMSAGEPEIDCMEEEGIEMEFLVSPVEILAKDGKVTGIRLVRNRLEEGKPVAIPGSEFVIECDAVIMAIGQTNEDLPGTKEVPEVNEVPQKDNFFLAGDFRNGSGTVIEACADGRKVARRAHQYLSGIKGYQDVVHIEEIKLDQLPRTREDDFIPLTTMPHIPVSERLAKNREVETGYTRELAQNEARRCYLCHYNFQIDIDRCIYCMACIDAMPVDCIKLAKDIDVGADGSLRYVSAAHWEEAQAITIDNDKCIRCGNCVRACPVDCISISKYTLETVEVE